jgi:hypothetical protein
MATAAQPLLSGEIFGARCRLGLVDAVRLRDQSTLPQDARGRLNAHLGTPDWQ